MTAKKKPSAPAGIVISNNTFHSGSLATEGGLLNLKHARLFRCWP